MNKKTGKIIALSFWALLLALYLAFPSNNISGDSWAYAGDVKYGLNLFYPHHLLYNATAFGFRHLLSFTGIPSLEFLIRMNGIAAWLSMLLLSALLRQLSIYGMRNNILVCIAAFSFGFWRFATEAEVYILPLLISLLSLYFFLAYYRKGRLSNLLLAGFFAALACLYHQIHIFWWAGQFMAGLWLFNKQRLKFAVLYSFPFLIVPAVYFAVIGFYFHQHLSFYNILHFVLHDFYAGEAGYTPGPQHLLLGAISTVRTFFQVHGLILYLLKKNIVLALPGVVSIILLLSAVFYFVGTPKRMSKENRSFIYLFLTIAVLQWLGALYNVGNAEFMVMLPALAVLILACCPDIPVRTLSLLAASLLVWNFSFAILPLNTLKLSAEKDMVEKYMQKPEQHKFYILSDHARAENIFYYDTGKTPANILASPTKYQEKYGSSADLKNRIDSALRTGAHIYTDCIGKPKLLSRGSLLYRKTDQDFFAPYTLLRSDSFRTDIGMVYLFKVKAGD